MDSYFEDKAVIFLENDDFDEQGNFKYDLRGRPLVVMLGGNFCPHCHHAAPAYNAFAQHARKTKQCVAAFLQVDKSANEGQLASRLGALFPAAARGVPCYLMFAPNGKYARAHDGERTTQALIEFAQNK